MAKFIEVLLWWVVLLIGMGIMSLVTVATAFGWFVRGGGDRR